MENQENQFSSWQEAYQQLNKLIDSSNTTTLDLINIIKTTNVGIKTTFEDHEKRLQAIEGLTSEQTKILQKFISEISTGITVLGEKIQMFSSSFEVYSKLFEALSKELKETKDEVNQLKEMINKR